MKIHCRLCEQCEDDCVCEQCVCVCVSSVDEHALWEQCG